MTMPLDLVLVRHGESEGNAANRRSRRGNHKEFTDEFSSRHSQSFRLTDKGIQQAKITGAWLRDELKMTFDRHYCSEYLRAMETAGLLDIPDSGWYPNSYLRERDWGDLDNMRDDARAGRFAEALEKRKVDSYFWSPPNGESMAHLCLRIDRVLDTLHRECSDKRVIIVCHGEVMWAFRVRLERMMQDRWQELDNSKKPFDKIHNCQILHYTRQNPKTDRRAPHANWMRSVNPGDLSKSSNIWMPIVRPKLSSAELLTYVERQERMVNSCVEKAE